MSFIPMISNRRTLVGSQIILSNLIGNWTKCREGVRLHPSQLACGFDWLKRSMTGGDKPIGSCHITLIKRLAWRTGFVR